MIEKSNLKSLLLSLNFKERDNQIFSKDINDIIFEVDFKKEKLIYPKGVKINDETTSNFSHPENFVVFECVHRLVEKGYNPEHIELEPRWNLGHNAKGGKADIQIKDNYGNSLLLIECKTAGSEYKNARKDTLEDGAQLFSYFQQEKKTKFLCLYSSDIVDENLKTSYCLINVQDNEEFLKNINDKEKKTYKDASTNKELFNVWKSVYSQDFSTRGLFEQDIQAYEIGKNKYTFNDLEEVDSDAIQKKYNDFATILRQHNVSGRENAFDKLVNLFLAKVVDEKNNPSDLSFYRKGSAYDDFFRLQDRLQKLYKDGMENFLNETVTYIDNNDIDQAFKLFKNDPDATKNTILEYFRTLKFFTNNDFAFIDVHNEHLFYQNAEILKKIVQMLQDIKLKTENQNQFLGDLFEGFLDQGVKQNEGQFFTPMPIVKFLISSLPLQNQINDSEIPLVIDYACGAGHFLNEYASQIKPFVAQKNGNLKEYFSRITGIEKEYRLSKVSKVASFMYGQDDIKIIYADALDKQDLENKYGVKNGTFSILIANPPYSVKGFLETLSDENKEEYTLTKEVSDISKNNSIECFFIERAAQLLKENGLAAIILPSSILSNGNLYIKTREILLKNFDIVAIAEFGSGTFGKTGTNTVTLFLRKKSGKPNLSEHYQNRIDSRFSGKDNKNKIFEDEHFIKEYCDKIQVNYEDYKELCNGKLSDNLTKNETFIEYKKSYQDKKLDKKNKKLIDFIVEIEKEKLLFFIFAKINPQPVLIIKSPSDNKAIKKFLGYEWKAAKGNEGIHYLGAGDSSEDEENFISKNKGINRIQTPLFDPNNLDNVTKINVLIRKNFLGENINIPDDLQEYVSKSYLVDMIDFSRTTFDKAIKTSAIKKIEIESKYLLESIDKITKGNIQSGSRPKGGVGNLSEGIFSLGGEHIDNFSGYINLNNPKFVSQDFYDNSNNGKIQQGDLLICKDGALTGKVAIVRGEFNGTNAMVNEHVFVVRSDDKITQNYLFRFFHSHIGQNILKQNITGAAQGGLNSTNLKNIRIPLPPLEIQKKIVEECQKIDDEYEKNELIIGEGKRKIEKLYFSGLKNGNLKKYRLSDNDLFDISIGRRILSTEVSEEYDIPVYSANVFEPFGRINKLLFTDFSKPSVLRGIDGDRMVNLINEHIKFFPTDHCGVIRIKTNKIMPNYFLRALNQEGKRNKFSRSYRASTDRIKSLNIQLPTIEIQKQIVAEIKIIEKEIESAKEIMNTCSFRKQEVLDKYLR